MKYAIGIVLLFVLGKAVYTYPDMKDRVALAHFQSGQAALEDDGYDVSDIQVFRTHEACMGNLEIEKEKLLSAKDTLKFFPITTHYKGDGSQSSFMVVVKDKSEFDQGLHCFNIRNERRSVFCKTTIAENDLQP